MKTTSPIIQMLKTATEVQSLWQQHRGDIIIDESKFTGSRDFSIFTLCVVLNGHYNKPLLIGESPDDRPKVEARVIEENDGTFLTECLVKDIIWYPTQEQLQELSGMDWFMFDKTCVTWAMTDTRYMNQSKEEVALQVLMKVRFNKKWNGSNWESYL